MKWNNVTACLAIWAFLNMGCGPRGNKPNVEIIQDMMDQHPVKAQEYDDFSSTGLSARQPPEGTKPRGKNVYPYATQPQAAAEKLKNPFEGRMDETILLQGQKYFNTHCLVCHGEKGQGAGPIQAKFPLPIPSLLSEKIRSWKDSQIYHVISAGQGVMGSYASHIPAESRWSVVNYIRYLQNQDSHKDK